MSERILPDQTPRSYTVSAVYHGYNDVNRQRVMGKFILLSNSELEKYDLSDETHVLSAIGPHPNIPSVICDQISTDQLPNINEPRNGFCSQYIDGASLAEVLKLSKLIGISPRIPHTMNYLMSIASVIDFADKQGYVHRDIKPDNILIETQTNRAYLADWNIAHRTQESKNNPVGSLLYLPPEIGRLIINKRGSYITSVQNDIYSLGVTVYELMTGEWPYANKAELAKLKSTSDIAQATCTNEIILPSNLPHLSNQLPMDELLKLNNIFLKVLAKSQDERYKNATEFIEDIETFSRTNAIHILEYGR